ncbi:RING-H2 finger protein ATL7 [Mucuna pruriens]|uniref:RING-type E3 ubiquitin transferase n=1 Tax=Mucuna pruriens TaxID=157652 RepID=A0A371EZ63_MUCPR|nr:RING-H2 finger protein ATL7 [Mucuna pruriens]
MISAGINLVMTVIGFAVSTMFIVFVCTRLICARIHLNASRRSFPIASRSNLSMMERGCHGLERAAVAKFPTKKFSDKFFAAAENSQCTVCLSEYQGEDMLRILPYCGHSFHVTCIDLWLQQNSTCPVCRISLREFPERKQLMQPLFSSALQPHYGIESFDTHHYHCMMAGNELPSRTPDNHGVNHIEEDHFPSEGGGAVAMDNITCLSEGDFIKNEGKKHVESPSNFQI